MKSFSMFSEHSFFLGPRHCLSHAWLVYVFIAVYICGSKALIMAMDIKEENQRLEKFLTTQSQPGFHLS